MRFQYSEKQAGRVLLLGDKNGGNELNVQRLAGMSILMAGQLFHSCHVLADTWKQGVSAQISTEYVTNPAMMATNQSSVWRAVFSPSYALMAKVGESSINTGLAYQITRASNKKLSPDRDSPSAYLNWLRPSDAGEFGLTSRYAQTATRDTSGIDATGNASVSSTSTSRNLSGSWNKELSERSTVSADGAYAGVSYSGSATYTNYSTRSGGLKYGYVWNEKINSFFRVGGNKYIPANAGPTSSRVETTLGMNWKAEYLDWSMQVGKSRVVGGNSDTQGSISAHYTGPRTQLALDAGRTVSPSGLGSFVKADYLKGGWSYALSEYGNAGIDLEQRKNYPTALISASTSTLSSIWLDHSLTEIWKMRTYCSRRTREGGGGESASSNTLGITLIYNNIAF